MRFAYLIACIALAACATSAPASSQWTRIEGCWNEQGDHWPASMEWRRDPAHPGAYVGLWQREAAQMDMERVQFTLAPVGDQMQLCLLTLNGPSRCAPTVFGNAGWQPNDVAVVVVNGDYHEFGFAGATMPVFWGNRRDCN